MTQHNRAYKSFRWEGGGPATSEAPVQAIDSDPRSRDLGNRSMPILNLGTSALPSVASTWGPLAGKLEGRSPVARVGPLAGRGVGRKAEQRNSQSHLRRVRDERGRTQGKPRGVWSPADNRLNPMREVPAVIAVAGGSHV